MAEEFDRIDEELEEEYDEEYSWEATEDVEWIKEMILRVLFRLSNEGKYAETFPFVLGRILDFNQTIDLALQNRIISELTKQNLIKWDKESHLMILTSDGYDFVREKMWEGKGKGRLF